jgi:hypothetical protein
MMPQRALLEPAQYHRLNFLFADLADVGPEHDDRRSEQARADQAGAQENGSRLKYNTKAHWLARLARDRPDLRESQSEPLQSRQGSRYMDPMMFVRFH